jgi:hypothetical protein
MILPEYDTICGEEPYQLSLDKVRKAMHHIGLLSVLLGLSDMTR